MTRTQRALLFLLFAVNLWALGWLAGHEPRRPPPALCMAAAGLDSGRVVEVVGSAPRGVPGLICWEEKGGLLP